MAKTNSGLLNNFGWKFMERILAQAVSLVVSIILARLLSPEDYGQVSIVLVFITVANVFVSDGFGAALIQKKNSDALDFCSVLYFNIVFSILLYLLIYFLAPLFANFFNSTQEFVLIIRVLGLRIVITGVNSVQHAYVSKKMIFRKFFWSTLFGTVVSAIVGITLAYLGLGVWALVAQYLTNTFIDTVVLAIVLNKRPRFIFSFARLKSLVGFGSKVLGTNLMITGFSEIRTILIGRVYSSADLAYYDRGQHFPKLIITNVNTSVSSVLFPKMANEQDDKKRVKDIARKSIRFSTYVMAPMMFGLAIVAEPFVKVILTDKWLACVPFLQLACIMYLFYPIHTTNMQIIKALGKGKLYLGIEIIKKTIELIVLFICVWISIEWVMIGSTILATLFTVVNAFPNKKLVDYSFKEQIIDIMSPFVMSFVMVGVVYLISLIQLPVIWSLIIRVCIGAITYVLLSFITKNKEFGYIINLIKSKVKRRKEV